MGFLMKRTQKIATAALTIALLGSASATFAPSGAAASSVSCDLVAAPNGDDSAAGTAAALFARPRP